MPERVLLGLALSALCVLGPACLVESQCQTDLDCDGDQTCDRLSGACRVECRKEADCYFQGMPIGKECVSHRCVFRYDERVKAPEFCLKDVNPKSGHYNKSVCLTALKGKVVLIFFGLLA